MEYYIVQKDGEIIYEGPDADLAFRLIPRHISMHKSAVYNFSSIILKDNHVIIEFSKGIGRAHWDSGEFECGKHSSIKIPKGNLEKLISNFQLNI